MSMIRLPTWILCLSTLAAADEWTPLLDPALSKWEVFIGIPHLSVEYPGLPSSGNEKCIDGTPVGSDGDSPALTVQLESLRALHEAGDLSHAEYAAAKDRVLGASA